jgi:hypothetical protein
VDPVELVWRAYDDCGSWPAVAAALGWSPTLWWQVAHDRRQPTREQANAVLRRYGMPEIPAPPSEIVAASGVRYVVQADGDDPDTAILARTGGEALARISITGAGVEIGEAGSAPRCRFTSGKTPQVKRSPTTTGVFTLSTIAPVDASREDRGKSGFRPAIADAARRAAELLATDPASTPDD